MRVKPLEMKNSNPSWLADFMTIHEENSSSNRKTPRIKRESRKRRILNGLVLEPWPNRSWRRKKKWQTHNMCRKAGAWWRCTTNSSNSNQKFSMFIFCIWTRGRFTVHSWTRSAQGRCLGPQSSGRRKLWLSFCIGCQHSHLNQRKALLLLWASAKAGFAVPMGLRHWGYWHSCAHVNKTHSLETSPTPYTHIHLSLPPLHINMYGK